MNATADPAPAARRPAKSPAAFRTISEVAGELDVPQHVLRFWETKFAQVRPLKRGGGRRYYRPEDVDLLRRIRQLLYADGYTIKGVQKLLRESASRPPPRAAVPPPSNLPDPTAAPPPARARVSPPLSAAAASPDRDAARHAELEALLAELEALRALIAEG
jgi:DNA-binding transcriptional MerR regulator